MKIAIFEDDREFANNLERLIRQYTHYPTVINTGDIEEMARWIEKTAEPVLYVLDIILGDKTAGFWIADLIEKKNSNSLIIFLTAYPQKINYNPYFKTKAFSVMYKDNPSLDIEIENTISLAEKALQDECLCIHVDKFQTLYIPYENICYIETIKNTNKLCIHCTDGQYVIRETLKSLLEQLSPFGFIRCHKSIIANQVNIRKWDKSTKTLIFHNGATSPYSYLAKWGLDRKP